MIENAIKVQGRILSKADVTFVVSLIQAEPTWSRWRLSREISTHWNWRNGSGQLKDMACRSMLLKLEKQGYITLPKRRRIPINRMLHKKQPILEHDQTPIVCSLKEIQPIRVVSTWQEKKYDDIFCSLLSQHHYKGYKGVVGENMKYVVLDRYNRIVSCLLFGSSAWSVASRDRFLGWDTASREDNLYLTTNNMRFLIPHWIQVPHLASHILGTVSRQISSDWLERYGHPIYMLETFVERERFRGTCYKASNWIYTGRTKGRSRNDRYSRINVSIKDVYVYPLIKDFKDKLLRSQRNSCELRKT
jgi:hypothetical protein